MAVRMRKSEPHEDLYDSDADLAPLKDKTVAVIGYGSRAMPMRRICVTAVRSSRRAAPRAALVAQSRGRGI